MEHLQVEDVRGVDDLLPDGEGEAVVAVGGVEDAGVIADSKAGFDDALEYDESFLCSSLPLASTSAIG